MGYDGMCMLGEFRKVELDAARNTHQLFSKLLVGEAIPKTLIYWSPELLRLEKYDKSIDMWALGITIYQMCTGEHPFTIDDEEKFRDESCSANVDLSRLDDYPRLRTTVENLLRVDPKRRWTSLDVLI